MPIIVGVPVVSDPLSGSRKRNSASGDNSAVSILSLENHSDHTAVTRLVPLLKRLAVGAKIPTQFHAPPAHEEGRGPAMTTGVEKIPIALRPPPPKPPSASRAGVAGDAPRPHLERVHLEAPRRSRLLRPATVGLALLAMLTVMGILAKAKTVRGIMVDARRSLESLQAPAPPSVETPQEASAAVAAMGTTGAVVAETAVGAPPVAELGLAEGACTVVGKPKILAGQALAATGIEIASSGRGIALGFASDPIHAVSFLVDPATLSVTARRVSRSHDAIRRVTPIPSAASAGAAPSKGHRPLLAMSTDRPGDPIAMRRTSSGASPIDLGFTNGHLVWAPHDSDDTRALWPLAGAAPAEALRAVPLEAPRRGYAIAFRRSGSIWTGIAASKGNHRLSASGDLSETKGLGAQVGVPSMAVSDDSVLVAWADRANGKDAWGLRYRKWHLPQADEAIAETPAAAFEVSSGGAGAPSMAPAVTSLGGGRFLIVWTEGTTSGHRVRGLTIDAEGHPQGEPLVIADDAGNVAQGRAAVLPDGHGMVAYLAATPRGFKVMATAIACH